MASLIYLENESSMNQKALNAEKLKQLQFVDNRKNLDTNQKVEVVELEEYENVSKTSTPLKFQQPFVWYMKWASSIVLIIAMVMTTNNMYPYNMYLQCIGVAGWLVVSIIWNDRALIIVNAVAVAIFLNGIFQYLIRG